MTHAEIKKVIIDTIEDYIAVAVNDKFVDYYSYPGIKFDKNLVGKQVYEIPLVGLGKSAKVLSVLKKLKEDSIIGDYTDDYVDIEFDHYKVVLSKLQVENFGKSSKPSFDSNTGFLYFQNNQCKFTKSSNQYKVMLLLSENQGRMIDYDTIAQMLWPHKASFAGLKINIQDTMRKIREKLSKCNIDAENIFLKTNDGYGLKD